MFGKLNPFNRHGEAKGGGTPSSDIEAFEVDEELSTEIYDAARRELPVLGIRPYPGDDPYKPGERLLKSLHTDDWEGKINVTNTSVEHALEHIYDDDDEILQFRFAPGDENAKHKMLSQLKEFYPDSDILELSPQFMDIPEGKKVVVCRLELMESNYHFPINHYAINPDDFEHDPLGAISRQMIGAPSMPDADVMVQTVLKPAISHHPNDAQNWYADIPDTLREMGETDTRFRKQAILEEAANAFRVAQGGQEREVEYSTSVNLDDDAAYKVVKNQYGEKGYHVNIRIIAVSDDAETAKRRVRETAGMYRNFYNSKNRQGFRTVPCNGEDGKELLLNAARREWVDRDITFAVDTATAACHVPTTLNNQKADYSMTRAGKGVPPRTPRFAYDEHGLDRATSDDAEIQKAILTTEDSNEPVWYGRGKRNGIEAGVWRYILDVHQFIGGSTGMGKTTLLIVLFLQLMYRGFGGLFVFPKGDDDPKKLVSLLPGFREDDLIYLDIGADNDNEIGFNFLEVPLTDPEPGSMSLASVEEAMADDIESLLAQSGDGSWHARMSGITRSVVRGLTEWQIATDRTVTMLDMYYALLDDDSRQQYADMLTQERIEWIEGYAQRVLSDIDQSDVEPLLRRMKEWVENGVTRRIVSHPSSTISIEEAVREGKIIVVRNRTNSDSAQRMITTALIRRVWMAIREQTNNPDEPDPPNFYAFVDEFDKVIAEESNFHDILKQARSFGLSITLSCQNLETGSKDDQGVPESVRRAIQGNCKTFVSFDPGDPKDAKAIAPQHSPDVDYETLLELSPYHFYMRTRDENDEKTDSYKVKGFPPADEVLERRSEDETEALIQQSQERYGAPARTNEEIKQDTLLYPGTTTDDSGDHDIDLDDLRPPTCKAVYDQSIREHDDGNEWVRLTDTEERIRRYLPDSAAFDTDAKLWNGLIAQLEETYLEREDRDGDVHLRCTDAGYRDFITPDYDPEDDEEINNNQGGAGHNLLIENAYDGLTKTGLVMSGVLGQSGESMPDAVATLDDVEDLEVDVGTQTLGVGHRRTGSRKQWTNFAEEHPLLDRLTDGQDLAIEAEKSTAETKFAQTVVNLIGAVNNGHRCLFLTRTEREAAKIWRRLAEHPRYCRDDYPKPGQHRLYNTSKDLRIGDRVMYRPAGAEQTVWVWDEPKGVYRLLDSDGEEHAVFDSAAAIFEQPDQYPLAEGETTDYDDWVEIKRPVVPEYDFDDVPGSEAWDVVVVGDGDGDSDGELSVYDGDVGELVPIEDLLEYESETESLDFLES